MCTMLGDSLRQRFVGWALKEASDVVVSADFSDDGFNEHCALSVFFFVFDAETKHN